MDVEDVVLIPQSANPNELILVSRPYEGPSDATFSVVVLAACCNGTFRYCMDRREDYSSCECGTVVRSNVKGWASQVAFDSVHSQFWGDWFKFWFGLDNVTMELNHE